jgi:hypothetical protein
MSQEGFDQLIEAFTIFRKYGEITRPTHCDHDVMYVCVDPDTVSQADQMRLEELGFLPSKDNEAAGDCFLSFRYGSA